MKKDRILNPELLRYVAAAGHTDYFVIADAGLPMPKDVPVIDLALTHGVPSLLQTLTAVCSELVTESYIAAQEMPQKSPALYAQIAAQMNGQPEKLVSHEDFKAMLPRAKAIVRTGETTPFANIILVCGVNF